MIPRIRWQSLLQFAILIAVNLLVCAASAEPIQRTVTVRITEAEGPWKGSCDVLRPGVLITLDGVEEKHKFQDLSYWGAGAFCAAVARSGPEPITSVSQSVVTSKCQVPIQMQHYDGNDFGSDDYYMPMFFYIDVFDETAHSGCFYPTGTGYGSDGGYCWEIDVDAPDEVDTDGDGLSDLAETNGVDLNCDGQMVVGEDLFLHEMGVSVGQKDILLELNWFAGHAPQRDSIEALKNAFSRAPENAGGVLTPGKGINVIVDAGSVYSDLPQHHTIGGRDLYTSASTDTTGACNSVEDFWGNVVPPVDPNVVPTSIDEAYAFVCHHDTARRRGVFRQVSMGPAVTVHVGGISLGNDRIYMEPEGSFGDEATRLMHELGHALDLTHGGGSLAVQLESDTIAEMNCEPNHYSIMNYLYSGVSYVQLDGETLHKPYKALPFDHKGDIWAVMDFSPARVPDSFDVSDETVDGNFRKEYLDSPTGCSGTCNTRLPVLPNLDESCLLDGPLLFDDVAQGIFYRQRLLFEDAGGTMHLEPMTANLDWDGAGVDANVCTKRSLNYFSRYVGTYATCTETEIGVLTDADEWWIVKIPPGRGAFGEAAGLHIAKTFVDEHRSEPLDLTELFTTDLGVTASLEPEHTRVGETTTLTVEAFNAGPGRAYGGKVDVTLPLGTTLASTLPSNCETVGSSRISCFLTDASGIRAMAAGTGVLMDFEILVTQTNSGEPRQILVGASKRGPDPYPENDAVVVQILSLPAFFGFDDDERPWVIAHTNGQQSAVTTALSDSDRALSLDCGNTQVDTPTFDTGELDMVGTELVMDVLVPTNQDQHWVGDLQLFVHIPSLGLNNQPQGRVELTGLSRGQFTEISFPISSTAQDALLADAPDARLRLVANVQTCGAPVLLDSVRFGGDILARTDFHSEAEGADIVSSGVLRFENSDDWRSDQTTLSLNANATEGSTSIGFEPAHWVSLVSRSFDTSELSNVSAKLGLDVYIPDLPPDYYWQGQLNVFVSCPDANIWTSFVGSEPLQLLFDDEFNRLTFDLPGSVVEVLSTPGNQCQVRLDVASNPAFGGILFDNAGFVQ